MSLENQIERLNNNIENLVGALVAFATNRVVNVTAPASAASTETATTSAPATTASGTPEKATGTGRGRRPTRYWKLTDGSAVKSSGADSPSAGAVEIEQAEYERIINSQAIQAHAKAVGADTPQADALSEDEPATPSITLEDVRTAAFSYRDKHGPEKAKALIKKHGSEKLAELPEANWSAFVAEANGKTEDESL